MITYHQHGDETKIARKRKINEWIKQVAQSYDKKLGDLSIVLCDVKNIVETNKQYLNHNYPTDIITFNYCEDHKISGDLMLCPPVIKENAKDAGVSFDNEMHRVIIHGVLHLIGFDDKTPKEQEIMREMENNALLALDCST